MVHITSLESGLGRLLRICPKLTLDPRAIQLIIDGKQNQVIHEHREAQKPKKIVVEATVPSISNTRDITIEDKSFNEYFKD